MGRGSAARRAAGAIGFALCAALFATGSVHAASTLPDLTVSAITATGSLTPGSTLTATVTTRNAGSVQAPATTTKVFTSKDQAAGSDDILLGQVSVPTLAPGATSTKTLTATVPKKSGNGELLGCADAAHAVNESHESNNCRAAADGDLDGWANFTDCAPTNGLISPGATDQPDVPNFADTNCDGIDGTVKAAVFVSPSGSDANPGTKTKPLRTLAAAMPIAFNARKDVYVHSGTYAETLQFANGVGVYGGYGASWARSLTAASVITGYTTTSTTTGALAHDITQATALQLVTLLPTAPSDPGASSYGLRGTNSPGLRLNRVTIQVPAGVTGADGAPGLVGAPGGDANGYAGGTTTWGRDGGHGGFGGSGYSDHIPGYNGAHGLLNGFDSDGRTGGPGGLGGPADTVGGAGGFGDSGVFVGDGSGGSPYNQSPGSGFWTTAHGQRGYDGTNGHGGGGGGGGGGEDCYFCVSVDSGGDGGGGGGGGEHGQGGGFGQGGGGSFGIYLDGSAGATVRASTIVTSNGGNGGAGAGGAFGGSGGFGAPGDPPDGSDAAAGGKGGDGGPGGRGGDGGGGAGGPSIGVYGLTSSATPGTTITVGIGGTGGLGGEGSGDGGGYGAGGISATYF